MQVFPERLRRVAPPNLNELIYLQPMSAAAVIFLLIGIGYAALMDYYRRSWNQIPPFIPGARPPSTRVSVVIALRNEEARVNDLLQALAAQDLPRNLMELLLVDDCSEDQTARQIETLSAQYRLPVTLIRMNDIIAQTTPPVAFKKKAIAAGVARASGTLIVTTDADCHFGARWLSTLALFYESTGAKFIAAPVNMPAGHSLLGRFQAIDFATLQAITGASVYRRVHAMCNGANLAYEKAAFEEAGGFTGIDHIASGDDLLLMYKIFQRHPDKVVYLKEEQAIVTTEAQPGWWDFFQQRIRWSSKSAHYEDKRMVAALLLVYLFNLGFLVFGIRALKSETSGFLLLSMLLLKIGVEYPLAATATRFFKQERLMRYFILLQPLHIAYVLLAGGLGPLVSYNWKGRRVHK